MNSKSLLHYPFSKWIFFLCLSWMSFSANAQTTVTFNHTGAAQTWTVPAGVTSVFIEAWGAQGQDAGIGGTAGLGGFTSGNLTVTPGEMLHLYVGGQSGFNGGGSGGINGNDQYEQPPIGTFGGNGGGASDVRQGGMAMENRVIVAGGGGGGAHNGVWPGCQVAGPAGNGGDGGDAIGSAGTAGVGAPCNCGGGGGAGGVGGDQLAGGSAGAYAGSFNCFRNTWQIGANGALGLGGSGSLAFHNGSGGGGGGGGGYYGGGSGGNGSDTTPGGGGGGGSSYSGGLTGSSMMAGVQSGDGLVKITYTESECPGFSSQTFNHTGALQNWVVPAGVTQITIQAKGAQGGSICCGYEGGLGADMTGDFAVTPGQILNIVVGGMGNPETYSSGGGGASGVGIGASTLIVAGGGGGINLGDQDYPERHATVNNSGNDGSSYFNSGGMGGNDGADNIYSGNNISRGGRGWNSGNAGSLGLNGSSPNTSTTNGTFGIGGGGGSVGSGWCNCGGGGGGYSGGGSGNINASGGGGGSYNAGTNQTNVGGINTGNGLVVISYCSDPCVDNDMDGYTDCDGDCDDNNPNLNPGSSPIMTSVVYHNPNSVTVYWSTIQGSTNYMMRYRKLGDPNWIEVTSFRAWRRLYSLMSCSTYEVQFKNYKNGAWNCWSDIQTFMTTGCPPPPKVAPNGTIRNAATPAQQEISLQLYPNPSKGAAVTVEINTQISQILQWTLSDLSGKPVQNGISDLTVGFNNFTIQSAHLPAGVYFFKAPMAEGMQVVKMIVE